MANVTPDDVVLVRWQDGTKPSFEIVQSGDPRLNTIQNLEQQAIAQLSGVLQARFPVIRALATVTVQGAPGDDLSLWRFGFVQLGFIQHDWAHYRGDTITEGSVFVARDRPPAMPRNICRDSVAKSGFMGIIQRYPFLEPVIFYEAETPITAWWNDWSTGFLPIGTKIPAGGKLVFMLRFGDSPSPRFWGLNRVNKTAQNINNIYSVQYSQAFATMFAMQKGPGKPIDVLKSFQWNVRWRAHFVGKTFNLTQAPPRPGDLMDMNISHVVNGAPIDHRFQSVIFDIHLPNCNNQQQDASDKPLVRESKRWEDWKVTH
jgi:hypothetical protein